MNPDPNAENAGSPPLPPTLPHGGIPNGDVLAEIERLQNQKAGWGNAILILVVSVLLFAGAGSKQWSWEIVAILLPILFIHELGHYVTMRVFNYRNLRMFFIPFFGAAVSGRHYNVPGWKKVIVSLMGPAPGILLGAIVGGAGMVLDQPLLVKVALFAVILNGINLAPVLPLDGGWIFHTLLFCRHPLLDAGFRVAAGVALIVGGQYSDERLLMFLGIFMLIGVPASYRLARITKTLRDRGVPPASSDDQTIPAATAVAIIDEVKRQLPTIHAPKLIAQQTLRIFENLNARPPGWLGTLALSVAYLGTVGLAVVFLALLMAGPRGLGAFPGAATRYLPKHAIECDDLEIRSGNAVTNSLSSTSITIVANFPKERDAVAAFKDLPKDAHATLTRFGSSVIVTLPSNDETARLTWVGELGKRTREFFVESEDASSTLSISCRFPSEQQASAVEAEAREYLNANLNRSLLPPWQPNDRRSADQRAAHRLARATYLQAQQASFGGTNESPEIKEIAQQLRQAFNRGEELKAQELSIKMQAARIDHALKQLALLKSRKADKLDPAVIDLYSTLITTTNRNERLRITSEFASMLGSLHPNDSGLADDRFASNGGFTSVDDRTVFLQFVAFKHTSDGPPALLKWLCAKGGMGMKYELWAGREE